MRSWSMTENQGEALQVALYVRDAIGLPATPIPPLVPAVPPAGLPAPTAADARAWQAWFDRLLARESEDARPTPRVAPHTELLTELLAVGPTPALGTAATDVLAAAQAWTVARRAAHLEEFRRRPHHERVVMTRLVADVEEALGHRAAPFVLRVVTLPVAGVWQDRPRRDLLLLSSAARDDEARLRAVLTPVVRELA